MKKKHSNKMKVINELKAPRFAESLVEIFTMTDYETSISKPNKGNIRYFKDEKGTFREIDEKKKKGRTVVAE